MLCAVLSYSKERVCNELRAGERKKDPDGHLFLGERCFYSAVPGTEEGEINRVSYADQPL